jgi:hypothetical protein
MGVTKNPPHTFMCSGGDVYRVDFEAGGERLHYLTGDPEQLPGSQFFAARVAAAEAYARSPHAR